jgi:hypothetical protein
MGWMAEGLEFESRLGQQFLSSPYRLHGYEAHPASYPMGTGDSISEVERLGREADHSPRTSAKVKNT